MVIQKIERVCFFFADEKKSHTHFKKKITYISAAAPLFAPQSLRLLPLSKTDFATEESGIESTHSQRRF
jgi:hypothetical protein